MSPVSWNLQHLFPCPLSQSMTFLFISLKVQTYQIRISTSSLSHRMYAFMYLLSSSAYYYWTDFIPILDSPLHLPTIFFPWGRLSGNSPLTNQHYTFFLCPESFSSCITTNLGIKLFTFYWQWHWAWWMPGRDPQLCHCLFPHCIC